MKVTKRDEGIYSIDDVLAPQYYESLLEEFIPVHNNWVFRKKEWNAGSKDDKYPMWGNLYKPTNAANKDEYTNSMLCLLYTSPSPRDGLLARMPSSA